jgi:hydroxypyruvate isomerase
MPTPALRQSAPDWCFYKEGFDPAVYYRRLREIGFRGAEMVAPERWAAARAAGLEIVNLSAPGMTDGLNRRENHAKLIPQIGESIRLAAANGIGQVIVFSGNRGAVGEEQGLANVVEALRILAPGAAKAGVTLAFEMLNSFDHQNYQADSSRYGFEVVRRVGSPAVQALYDVYHMRRMGEDVRATLLPGLAQVCHLHVAESPTRGIPRPEGTTDYRGLVRAVRSAGYAGYWGQEFVPAGDPLEELARAFALFESFVVS